MGDQAVVFIPTRNRADLVSRVLPKWAEQDDVRVILVVEKWERGKYMRVAGARADVLVLPRSNRGINYARAWIVREADRMGLKQIIMSDDDLFPRPQSDISRLFEFGDLQTLGIGIMLPFYGLMFGNDVIKNSDEPLMSLGGLGKRCFSLRIEDTLTAGNFDPKLHSGWGDDELVRQGIAAQGFTWYVHAGVHGTSIAGRHTPGGLNDLHKEDDDKRMRAQFACHKIIYSRWGPEYISKPKLYGRLICQWKKMFNDYVPNWEARVTWRSQ